MDNTSTDLYSTLPPWPHYESEPSFRRWIDGAELAPDYTLAWLLRFIQTPELRYA